MSRTVRELAREAIQVQDACNLSGVAHSFAKAMSDLGEHTNGTDERNRHPIVRVYLDKMCDLTGVGICGEAFSDSWAKVREMAEFWVKE